MAPAQYVQKLARTVVSIFGKLSGTEHRVVIIKVTTRYQEDPVEKKPQASRHPVKSVDRRCRSKHECIGNVKLGLVLAIMVKDDCKMAMAGVDSKLLIGFAQV
jgi:hypothetical protein